MTARARALRAHQTEAERRLWAHLRRRQLAGARFRRQQPIGPHVVDFYCHAAGLVIELDGSQHLETGPMQRDAARDRHLERCGLRVLRFTNRDVLTRLRMVLEEIERQLRASPLP